MSEDNSLPMPTNILAIFGSAFCSFWRSVLNQIRRRWVQQAASVARLWEHLDTNRWLESASEDLPHLSIRSKDCSDHLNKQNCDDNISEHEKRCYYNSNDDGGGGAKEEEENDHDGNYGDNSSATIPASNDAVNRGDRKLNVLQGAPGQPEEQATHTFGLR